MATGPGRLAAYNAYASMPNSTPQPVPRPCACTTVRKASRVLARVYDEALRPSGLETTQLAVLRAIERHPGEPLTRVAEDLRMDRTSLYRAVGAMKRRGWVRVHTGADARSSRASITPRGQDVLKAADPRWRAVQSSIVGRFGVERWARLVQELEDLSSAARADDTDRSNEESNHARA